MVIFDDDHYYMGGLLAEQCALAGNRVTLVTPAALVSAWTTDTLEAVAILRRLLTLGVEVHTYSNLKQLSAEAVVIECQLTGKQREIACSALVSVTARLPVDDLHSALAGLAGELAAAGNRSLCAIGDAFGPGTIAAAVYQGHRFARELGNPAGESSRFKRELPIIRQEL